MMEKCRVCDRHQVDIPTVAGMATVNCPLCGRYRISDAPYIFNEIREYRHIVSGITRNVWEATGKPFDVRSDSVIPYARLLKASPIPIPRETDIPAKADLILHHLQRRSKYPGMELRLRGYHDYSVGFCRNHEELHFCVNYLAKRGFVDHPHPPEGADLFCRITPEGWAYLSGIATDAMDQGFIAMAFSLDFSNRLRDAGLIPGIEQAGYYPQRIDRKEHNNRIDDEIVAEIRKSKFVVADLTGNNQGAYYEAGFAQGLSKPVIWTCEKRQLDAKDIHFDVRQYSIVTWEPDQLDDFAKRLTLRIEATLGRGRYKSKLVETASAG
jgi:hypothetical protein